jgi:murein DD-endopeptidase MepM/ murein hydrolase activator NlpD
MAAGISLLLGIAGLEKPADGPGRRPQVSDTAPPALALAVPRSDVATVPAPTALTPPPPTRPDAESPAAMAFVAPELPLLRRAAASQEIRSLPVLVSASDLGKTLIFAPELAPPGPTPGLLLGVALMRAPIFPILEPPDASDAAALDQPPAEPKMLVRKVTIKRGDTLAKALLRGGAESSEAFAATAALTKVQDPRKLRIGQELTLTFDRAEDAGPHLIDVSLAAGVDRSVVARMDPTGDFKAQAIERPLEEDTVAVAGDIDGSLYAAADAAGVPARIIVDMIKLYSFDVDFQRDIQPGDSFQLFFQVLRNADGDMVKTQDILFARLSVGGKELPLYRFRHKDGDVEYYNNRGESVRKALMKTPIDGARLSSGFGLRRHPILGYTKMHRGLDFAAPRGTPIMAAGDGKVEVARWYGGYGRYVRIRHNTEFETAYGHMTRFAAGIHSGSRVRQGDVIGYVGTTGRSTGPHLHYEVLRDGRQVNPMGLKLPTGRTLSGDERTAFQKLRQSVDANYLAALPAPTRMAKTDAQ